MIESIYHRNLKCKLGYLVCVCELRCNRTLLLRALLPKGVQKILSCCTSGRGAGSRCPLPPLCFFLDPPALFFKPGLEFLIHQSFFDFHDDLISFPLPFLYNQELITVYYKGILVGILRPTSFSHITWWEEH